MRYIIMTNSGYDNNVITELIQSKLRPTIIVTDGPFDVEHKSIIKKIFHKTSLWLRYFLNRNEAKKKYQAYFLAKKHHIPLYPSFKVNSDDFAQKIKDNEIDYIFTFSFRILKEKIYKAPKNGTINFHPALLPMNRGASPVNWVIKKAQNKTGVTFHYIDKGIDTGQILEQYEVSLTGHETAKILNQYLFSIGSVLLVKLIYKLIYGLRLVVTKNNYDDGSYESPFRKAHSIISEQNTMQEIESIIRASRIVEYYAVYSFNYKEYQVINSLDLTGFDNTKNKFPYKDSVGNIVIKTKDKKSILLVTKNENNY